MCMDRCEGVRAKITVYKDGLKCLTAIRDALLNRVRCFLFY